MNKKGFSIIEMLIVISIFAVIGILVTSAMSQTLRGSKKSDSLIRVRESVNYSLSVIERQIRNSESITPCTGAPSTSLNYRTIEGIQTSFTCTSLGPSGYIASGSARLTSTDISVTACSFTCSDLNANNPSIVTLNITAEDATNTSIEKGSVTSQIEIITRNY